MDNVSRSCFSHLLHSFAYDPFVDSNLDSAEITSGSNNFNHLKEKILNFNREVKERDMFLHQKELSFHYFTKLDEFQFG